MSNGLQQLCKGAFSRAGDEDITVTFKDYFDNTPPQIEMITLDLTTTPTQLFEFEQKEKVWTKKQ